MSPATQGAIVLIVTLVVLLSGAPVAFGLGAIAISFLVIFQGLDSLHVAAETFYTGLSDFTLVSIPMFVMMGAAIGSSPAGSIAYPAAWSSPISGLARSLPRSRAHRPPAVPPSARWAFRKCDGAGIRTMSPPARSARAARSAS